jgi:hypothetical protein
MTYMYEFRLAMYNHAWICTHMLERNHRSRFMIGALTLNNT